jgi:hypothetical protein
MEMVVLSKISTRFICPVFFLVFGVAVINKTTLPEFAFPSDDIKVTGDEKIIIPNSVFVSGKYGIRVMIEKQFKRKRFHFIFFK